MNKTLLTKRRWLTAEETIEAEMLADMPRVVSAPPRITPHDIDGRTMQCRACWKSAVECLSNVRESCAGTPVEAR